jgi:hypothetical protein
MTDRNQPPPVSQASRVGKAWPRNLDPWELIWGQPYIDALQLAAAIEEDLQHTPEPDFRTRLLVQDAARAIQSFWGSRKFGRWLQSSPVGARVRNILEEDLGEPGFPSIRRRLVSTIGADQVQQIFDLLGRGIHHRVEVTIAGSIPTLIEGLTSRPTADIDLVNEVPDEIRKQKRLLEKIETEFGLTLGHVQSHYLPANWEQRRKYLGDFGGLRVYLVDEYDIFVSKLSSKQEKHQQDLRVLAPKLDREIARERLLRDGQAFLKESSLRPQIEENWKFIYQEPLFPKPSRKAKPKTKEPGQTGKEARKGPKGPKKTNGSKPKGKE